MPTKRCSRPKFGILNFNALFRVSRLLGVAFVGSGLMGLI